MRQKRLQAKTDPETTKSHEMLRGGQVLVDELQLGSQSLYLPKVTLKRHGSAPSCVKPVGHSGFLLTHLRFILSIIFFYSICLPLNTL